MTQTTGRLTTNELKVFNQILKPVYKKMASNADRTFTASVWAKTQGIELSDERIAFVVSRKYSK